MDPTNSDRSKEYLVVSDVRKIINKNTPTFLSQTVKTVTGSLAAAVGGGLIGKALPLIEEAYPGIFGTLPEQALSFVKPIFVTYLAPTIATTDYIPIALATLTGALTFTCLYYRQRSLSTKVATANVILGNNPNKIVQQSEFETIKRILPTLTFENLIKDKLVIADDKLSQLAFKNKTEKEKTIFKGLSNKEFADHPFINSLLLRTNILDSSTYEEIHKKLNANEKDAMSWMLNWPAFADRNRQNIRQIVQNIKDDKPDFKLMRNAWDNLNDNERKALFRLLQAPELPEQRAKWTDGFNAIKEDEINAQKQAKNNTNNDNQNGDESPSLNFSDSSSG